MNTNWHFAYTPYIWPMLSSAVLCSFLGLYAWKRRAISGAFPFSVMLLFMMLWSLGVTLGIAAEDLTAKIFWFKFSGIMKLPAATAEFCFGIQFTGLGRLLTRRNLILLSVPPLLVFFLVLTNNIHHLLWLGFYFDGHLSPIRSTLTYVVAGYSFLLALVMFVIFFRLLVRFPQHRWPAILILAELVIARAAVLPDYLGVNPVAPMDLVVLMWNVGAILYAAVLFGYRIFDEITLARRTAIEQLHAGMLVVDIQGRVLSLNPAAQGILAASSRHLQGTPVVDLLPEYSALRWDLPKEEVKRIELSRGNGSEKRYFTLAASELKDWFGATNGRLLLLLDVTEQRQTQAQLMDQQRALAVLQERERLARDLHDSIGQVLGYVGFQTDAISKLVIDGQFSTARTQLERLAAIAREAHADIREFILDLHAVHTQEKPFFTVMQNYLEAFTNNYEIQTLLHVDERLINEFLPPDSRMQLIRILQESLSNARKHGHARRVQVTFGMEDHRLRMTIEDDGVGFDTSNTASVSDAHFGLRFMRERAEALGGCLEVTSKPGQGTQVVAEAPIGTPSSIKEDEVSNGRTIGA